MEYQLYINELAQTIAYLTYLEPCLCPTSMQNEIKKQYNCTACDYLSAENTLKEQGF